MRNVRFSCVKEGYFTSYRDVLRMRVFDIWSVIYFPAYVVRGGRARRPPAALGLTQSMTNLGLTQSMTKFRRKFGNNRPYFGHNRP